MECLSKAGRSLRSNARRGALARLPKNSPKDRSTCGFCILRGSPARSFRAGSFRPRRRIPSGFVLSGTAD